MSLLDKLPWVEGRQGTGYKKLRLFQSERLNLDCYLLYMPQGSYIPPHKDEVDSGEHYRCNVIIHQPQEGGEFSIAHTILETKRVKLFRPDQYEHLVSRIEKGYRLALSIGFKKVSENT